MFCLNSVQHLPPVPPWAPPRGYVLQQEGPLYLLPRPTASREAWHLEPMTPIWAGDRLWLPGVEREAGRYSLSFHRWNPEGSSMGVRGRFPVPEPPKQVVTWVEEETVHLAGLLAREGQLVHLTVPLHRFRPRAGATTREDGWHVTTLWTGSSARCVAFLTLPPRSPLTWAAVTDHHDHLRLQWGDMTGDTRSIVLDASVKPSRRSSEERWHIAWNVRGGPSPIVAVQTRPDAARIFTLTAPSGRPRETQVEWPWRVSPRAMALQWTPEGLKVTASLLAGGVAVLHLDPFRGTVLRAWRFPRGASPVVHLTEDLILLGLRMQSQEWEKSSIWGQRVGADRVAGVPHASHANLPVPVLLKVSEATVLFPHRPAALRPLAQHLARGDGRYPRLNPQPGTGGYGSHTIFRLPPPTHPPQVPVGLWLYRRLLSDATRRSPFPGRYVHPRRRDEYAFIDLRALLRYWGEPEIGIER